MTLGFGSAEVETAIEIIKECLARKDKDEKKFEREIAKIENKYAALREEYRHKSADKIPERYSYFWHSLYKIYDGYFIIVFVFHHINRRHPFSPDGWALSVSHWIAEVRFDDDEARIYKSVWVTS